MIPFYRWDSTVSRLRSHYKDTVYFLPLSFQEHLVLEQLEHLAKLTFKLPSCFEPETP